AVHYITLEKVPQGCARLRGCDSLLYKERSMADIVRKRVVSVEGPSVSERLQAMDDSAVVTAFLGGEERAFSELVTRYQTRLLNFVSPSMVDREKAEELVQEPF